MDKNILKQIGEFISAKFSKEEIDTIKADAAKFNLALPAPIVAPIAPVTLKEATTKDGKKISYDGELATGTVVTVMDAVAGTAAPLPIGEYELEDGTKFSVTEAGKVAVVTPIVAATPVDTGAVQQMKVEMSAQKTAFDTKLSAYETESKTIKTELSELKASHGKLLTQFSKMLETPIPVVTKTRGEDVDVSQLKGLARHKAIKEMNS